MIAAGGVTINQGGTLQGPPLGRHVAAVTLTAALMLLFFWLDANPEGGGSLPLSHAVLADTSLVLLCLILMLGAVARVVPRSRRVVPWARELGIAMFVTAGLHIAILVGPSLEVSGFFGVRSFRGFEFGTRMWDAANWVGVVALGYALVLAATSNDWSQRKLGRGWKFLQRQTYTLFVLAWLHTAAFVVLGAGHAVTLFTWLFWSVTTVAVVFQLAGFVHTVRAPRGPSPYRAPPKIGAKSSAAMSMGAGKVVRSRGTVGCRHRGFVGSRAR
ncbi:MAG: ferric reductase-like transmembrane domain-containing protein [Actinobacteria bacterium]|nr:ferric reductase-like transmembrane domain-containing protein [Actinomycetota bacterium]